MWWLVLPGSAPLATKPTGLALQAATKPSLYGLATSPAGAFQAGTSKVLSLA